MDSTTVSVSQFLCKANNTVCFPEACIQVELQALGVGQLAVAGKFGTALACGPAFAGSQKTPCDAHFSEAVGYIGALQVANRRAVRSLNIVVTELALGKTDGGFVVERKKEGGMVSISHLREFIRKLPQIVPRPQKQSKGSSGRYIG